MFNQKLFILSLICVLVTFQFGTVETKATPQEIMQSQFRSIVDKTSMIIPVHPAIGTIKTRNNDTLIILSTDKYSFDWKNISTEDYFDKSYGYTGFFTDLVCSDYNLTFLVTYTINNGENRTDYISVNNS